nr:MAG TPA: hypothetical protein [Caudoviricetes sp.]
MYLPRLVKKLSLIIDCQVQREKALCVFVPLAF